MHGLKTTRPSTLLAWWLVTWAMSWSAAARADDPLTKGPWLLAAQTHRVTVRFETTEPETAAVQAWVEEPVAPAGGARAKARASGPIVAASPRSTMHQVVLDGLRANTLYRYRIGLPSGGAVEGRFRTPPPPGHGPIHFVVYGDSRSNPDAHAAVVRAIVRDRPEFVVNTGDMVAKGDDEADWQRFFKIEEPLLREVPFFPTVGNHELLDHGDGLTLYDRYIAVTQPRQGATYYAFTWGPVRFLMLDSNDDWKRGNPQWQWLEHALEDAEADPNVHHLFVAMHQGPYSSGYHGGDPALAASGVPEMLRQHGVELVFAGHDHDYERGEVDGLKYIVSGGAGAPLYPFNRKQPGQLAFAPVHHFIDVRIDGERVLLTTRKPDGTVLERCGFTHGGPFQCTTSLSHATAAGAATAPVAAGPSARSFDGRRRRFWLGLAGGLLVIAVVMLGGRALARRRGRR